MSDDMEIKITEDSVTTGSHEDFEEVAANSPDDWVIKISMTRNGETMMETGAVCDGEVHPLQALVETMTTTLKLIKDQSEAVNNTTTDSVH